MLASRHLRLNACCLRPALIQHSDADQPIMQTSYRPPSAEKEGEEEAHRPAEGAAALLDTSPKRNTQGASAKIQRSRSYGNGYGCTTFDDEEKDAKDVEQGQHTNKQFEVRFEGDFDPMNPRSFGKSRKWVSTFCVMYLDCHPMKLPPIPSYWQYLLTPMPRSSSS